MSVIPPWEMDVVQVPYSVDTIYVYNCEICEFPFSSLTELNSIRICPICNDESKWKFPCGCCNGWLQSFERSGIGIQWLACTVCGGISLHKTLVRNLSTTWTSLYRSRYGNKPPETTPDESPPRRLEIE